MKVAITGKGGVGKTTLAAALARTFARSGQNVVALDADPNPNLGIALGLGVDDTERLDSVVNFLLRRDMAHSHGDGIGSTAQIGADELLDRLGVSGPDRVRLIQTGRIERPSEGCLCCGSHRATRRLFEELPAEGRVIVADLEAGVIDLCWTDPKPMDTVLVVTTPDRNSLEVARRAVQVTRDLDVGRVVIVANRLEEPEQADAVRDFLPDSEMVEIPEDGAMAVAERRGISLIDLAADCPALQSVGILASRLLDR